MPLESTMKAKGTIIKQKDIQDIRFMDDSHVAPIVSYPSQSSLFTKTTDLINSFFAKSNEPNAHVPRYLSGARSDN